MLSITKHNLHFVYLDLRTNIGNIIQGSPCHSKWYDTGDTYRSDKELAHGLP